VLKKVALVAPATTAESVMRRLNQVTTVIFASTDGQKQLAIPRITLAIGQVQNLPTSITAEYIQWREAIRSRNNTAE
jgi:hypothetical protein